MSFDADIFGTPLVRLARLVPGGNVFGKAEFMRPTGSVFDRIAGRLTAEAPTGPIIVCASGSPAIAFAAAATVQKRSLTVILPRTTLPEHVDLLRRHPIEVVLIDGDLEATTAAAEGRPGTVVFGPAIVESVEAAFEATLGRELKGMLPPKPEAITLIAPVLSGALLTGVARALTAAGHAVQTVGTLRPSGRASFQDGVSVAPAVALTRTVVVDDTTAHETRLGLARSEGILVGMGAAAAVHVAAQESKRDVRVITILVDAGDRYFSVDRKLKG